MWQQNISSSLGENLCNRMNIQGRNGGRANGIESDRRSMPAGFNDNVGFINFYRG